MENPQNKNSKIRIIFIIAGCLLITLVTLNVYKRNQQRNAFLDAKERCGGYPEALVATSSLFTGGRGRFKQVQEPIYKDSVKYVCSASSKN